MCVCACACVCVRPSVHVQNISYIIGGRNPKFSVCIHLGVSECCLLFSGHCDLDLWISSRKIMFGAYLLYYMT